MAGTQTPREVLKCLLQGVFPLRPLRVPIVFALGARVENVSLRAFLNNPTKITNALRQLRGPLRADGLTCYFDPLLEAEALGADLDWREDGEPPQLTWPHGAIAGELPRNLRSPEEAARAGRVPIAVETIRRLKAMVRDDILLTAGVIGPFTLAARILQMDFGAPLRFEKLLPVALDLAGAAVTQISSALVEAGANVIFLHEENFPVFSEQACEAWGSLLEPAVNIIRFYDALPALLLGDGPNRSRFAESALPKSWSCAWCLEPQVWSGLPLAATAKLSAASRGIAIPVEAFRSAHSGSPHARATASWDAREFRPAIVTTAGDVPTMADAGNLVNIVEEALR